MHHAKVVLLAAAVVAACACGVALASGGPPPSAPADPPANAIVAVGIGRADVATLARARRTDITVDRAVAAARVRAMPRAVAAARREAAALATATGLRMGAVTAVRRDVSPPGYWNGEDGHFGPGKWCGRIYDGRRLVRRADGTTRRVARFHHGCKMPSEVGVRLTVTFAATP